MLMVEKNSTVAEDQSSWDEGSLKEPERAMLCERPTFVHPLTHEEQIHWHGRAVLSPHNPTLQIKTADIKLNLYLS